MLGLPWWAWVVLAVVVAVLLLKIGARRWRAAYRREFIAYLRREAPDFEIVAEREYELDLRRGGSAAIPDRDTLVLTMVPANGDWSAVRKLARTPAGEALWPEPLQVTSAGIAAV